MNRVVPLEGGRNFRDLGGYRAAGGRETRWGVLYRSGTLGRLTPGDAAALRDLGLRVICDLRATDERAAEPTRLSIGARVLSWDFLSETRAFVTALRSIAEAGPSAMRAAMIETYRAIPEGFRDRYRELFVEVIQGNLPLVFHCTVGKDRTGVAAALLLTTLGVPRELVIEDYCLSERLIVGHEVAVPANLGGAAGARSLRAADDGLLAAMARLPPAIARPLLAADADYLLAALAAVERAYGSVEAYVERGLGLGPHAVARLRERLLEP